MRPEVSPDLLTAALKNSMSLQTVFDSLFGYEEAFVRVMAEGIEGAYRGARRGAPFVDWIARGVPFPTPVGMLDEKTYNWIKGSWTGPARALAPPFPTDPTFISWDAGFLWGIVTFVKHSVGGAVSSSGIPTTAVLEAIELLRSLPNLWGEIGRFLSYLPLRVRVAYACGTQPDTPFDAGKTVGIGVAWIVTIWFIIRQVLQIAREFGTVLRECGAMARLARDPAGFADDAGRLFGPGHKPATPEQRARIKEGVDRVGQPGAKPAPARRPGSVAPTAGTWREAQAIVEEGKFGYIFGRATGDPHGAARSTGLLAEMRRLGIRDDATGREILREHFRAVIADDSSVSLTVLRRHGTFERRESLLAGPSGKFALVESDWQVMPGGARRFVTMVVKRGQR